MSAPTDPAPGTPVSGSPLSCPKCGQPLEPGFLVGGFPPHFDQADWVAGDPTFTPGKGVAGDDKRHHKVRTHRCTACGYLESYAR